MEADIEKMHAVKSGRSFLLADKNGELPMDADSPCGIYRDDMRLVRAFTVAVAGDAAIVNRDFAFYDGNLYQRIEISAQGAAPAKVHVNFMPGCDDIFDVRNADTRLLPHDQKPFRGTGAATDRHAQGMTLSATGDTTQTVFKTGLHASHAGSWQGDIFELDLQTVQTGENHILYLTAGDVQTRLPGALQEQFEEAVRKAKKDKEKLYDYGPRLSVADPLTQEALVRGQEDLSVMITDLETGPYPYAGLPWFSCPFGRDALITALLLMEHYPPLAKGVLAFQAKHQATENDQFRQAETGKIFHEMRFGEASAAGENPFSAYYGGVDTTPLFVMVAHEYYKKTQDDAFIKSIWPHLEKALAWIENNLQANGGFLRYHYDKNGLTQQCWKDSADSIFSMDNPQQLAKDPIATCEVQAYAYEALRAGAVFAALTGKSDAAARYDRMAQDLHTRFNDKFWMEDQSCYAMALDGDDHPCAVVSSNAGHCLLSGIAPDDRAEKVAKRLMQADSFSGYGIRTLAEGTGYDPLSYHRGSVWPHDTAMVALGMRKHGFDDFSRKIADGLRDVYKHIRKIPELFSGDARQDTQNTGPRPYPSACLIQTWAAAAFISLAPDVQQKPQVCKNTATNGGNGVKLV
jgi:glycogen debranching enzyme